MSADPHELQSLFKGGAEPWWDTLGPVLAKNPQGGRFLGPARDKRMVPVRELTFQALKANPPERWRVVVFGQNPYPRVESATGIAMFDNAIKSWKDPRFPQVASLTNLLRAALHWRHKTPPDLDPFQLPALLEEHQVVPPAEWFQALLAQGVLLLNASLTAGGGVALEAHTAFWRPVIEAVTHGILKARHEAPEADRGVVFAWWGVHARALRPMVEGLERRFPLARVRHLDHWNPAARDGRFCHGNHFHAVNTALLSVGAPRVGWLPTPGWQDRLLPSRAQAEKMETFIASTQELHALFLKRLQDASSEPEGDLEPLTGILERAREPFLQALGPVEGALAQVHGAVQHCWLHATSAKGGTELDPDAHAAVRLYTAGAGFYTRLNRALRDRDRSQVAPFLSYLRLLLEALGRLPPLAMTLWRGVGLDLRDRYREGAEVVWWGVSSCSTRVEVARGFLGARGTLFEVCARRAVSLRRFSAFAGEDECVLAPGTVLRVRRVRSEGALHRIALEELEAPRRVG
ncbi:MAG: uracil-DNA glycosylase [Deltaproteobacteria bacterium]|nr:uracil-DNA glycosylase [Deltaproteobacteria bacterium]